MSSVIFFNFYFFIESKIGFHKTHLWQWNHHWLTTIASIAFISVRFQHAGLQIWLCITHQLQINWQNVEFQFQTTRAACPWSLVSYRKALNSLQLQPHFCPVISDQNRILYMAVHSHKIRYAITEHFNNITASLPIKPGHQNVTMAIIFSNTE